MKSKGSRHASLLVAGALALAGRNARAQSTEPLCATVQSRRLVSGTWLDPESSDRMVAQPLLASGEGGARFVVAVRDPSHTLRAGDARNAVREAEELNYEAMGGLAARVPSGLTIVRFDAGLEPVGEPIFLQDPAGAQQGATPASPVGVALPAGVLVLQILRGDVYATVVPPAGPVPAPARVAQAPSPAANEQGGRGFAWLTATSRGGGAIALAGTAQGVVVTLRFDARGARVGEPGIWTQRVGGSMELLPMGDEGPMAALLARPVRGTGSEGEQARQQVAVVLDETLNPMGLPFATGFAQFPMAMVRRGRSLVMMQWAQQQGVAIATLPIEERRLGERLPRLWYAQPPLEGANAGQAAVLGPGNIVYDVVLYSDVGGGLHGHVVWVPPSGVPTVRRDVLPVRARLAAAPQVLAAADGVVALLATYDETGGAIDAFHVRCDLVSLPAQSR